MKTAAARAIADIVSGDELREDYIIPSVFNREVAPAVAAAVADEARDSGLADAARRARVRGDRGAAAGTVGTLVADLAREVQPAGGASFPG